MDWKQFFKNRVATTDLVCDPVPMLSLTTSVYLQQMKILFTFAFIFHIHLFIAQLPHFFFCRCWPIARPLQVEAASTGPVLNI